MKTLVIFLCLVISGGAYAKSYTGRVEKLLPQKESVVIDGMTYKMTHKTVVRINNKLTSIDFVKPGIDIRYSINQLSNGERFLTEVSFTLPEEIARQIIVH